MTPQGKRGTPAAQPRAGLTPARKRLAALVFGAVLIVLFVVVAVAQGLGHPSVPDGDVAVVEDAPDAQDPDADEATITQEDFDRALTQTAAAQGLKAAPKPGDEQYQQYSDAALSNLLIIRWVLGEAEERGIDISDRAVDERFDQIKSQQFKTEKDFQAFLDQSGFTLEDVKDQVRFQIAQEELQSKIIPQDPSISQDQIDSYYEENKAQFERPETRDIRVVVTKTEEEANQAKTALGSDPSAKTWKTVAKKFSIDEATKDNGGLRPSVVAGQSEPALDDQAFSATEGELVGPFQGDNGFYIVQVEKVTPASTTPVADATEQIKQTLIAAQQQQLADQFQTDFQTKWIARTFCADDYRISQCSNAEPPPSACTETLAETTGCDAPVASTKPIPPGTATVFGGTAPTGLPQGPITPAAAAPAQLPAGVGIPGATAPPAGATPTAPQGAAPQTAPAPGG